jgi:hypothetical protein
MRPFDFRETVEGPGGDAGAIVVQRAVLACVRRRSLRIGGIVGSRNDRRMLEKTWRVSAVGCERGDCGQRDDERED